MKVIKVLNFKTSEFYFAVVEDQDNRIDPLEIFTQNLTTNTPSHRMANCNRQVLKTNLSKEAAAAEVRIQRKKNPGFITLKKDPEPNPIVRMVKWEHAPDNVVDVVEPEKPSKDVAKDLKEDKLINTKKGTNNV